MILYFKRVDLVKGSSHEQLYDTMPFDRRQPTTRSIPFVTYSAHTYRVRISHFENRNYENNVHQQYLYNLYFFKFDEITDHRCKNAQLFSHLNTPNNIIYAYNLLTYGRISSSNYKIFHHKEIVYGVHTKSHGRSKPQSSMQQTGSDYPDL